MKTTLILLSSIFILFSESHSQWTQTNLYGRKVFSLAANDSFLFACTSNGLFRSADNGNHWQEISSGWKPKSFFGMVVIGNNIISYNYSSSNNGNDWVEHQLKNIGNTDIVVVDDSVLFVGRDTAVYYSNDMGFNWKKTGSGFPVGQKIHSLSKSGSTLYVGGEGQVFRSTDKGNVWEKLGNDLNSMIIERIYNKDSTTFVASGYYLYYKNSSDSLWRQFWSPIGKVRGIIQKDSVLLVGIDGYDELIYRSTNNGKEWLPIRLDHTNKLSTVVSMITKGNTVFVATDGGRMFYSSDEGITWEESKNTRLRSKIYVEQLASCGGVLFAASEAGISASSDNGLSWTFTDIIQKPIVLSSNGTSVFALIRSMDSIGRFGPKPYDSLIRSIDCGVTWASLKTGLEKKDIKHFAECNSVLYACTDSEVYKRTDSGESWVKIKGISFSRIIAMTSEDTTIYLLTENSVNFSTNQWKTWEEISYRQDGTYKFTPISIVVKDKRILLGTYHDGLYCIDTTLDQYNYRKIVKINDGKTLEQFNRFIVSGSNIFVATDEQIYKSTDDGKSWTIIDSLLHKYRINTFIAHGSALYTARGTAGVWKYENILDVKSDENPEPMQGSHIHCYPNPTGNSLTINRTGMSFNNAHSVQYILSNCIGEKVMEFEQSEQVFTVQLDGLPSGIYSLSATQGVQRATVMVSVLK